MCRSEPVVPYSAQPGKSGRDCFPHGTEPARHQTITPLRHRVVGAVTELSLYPSMPQPTRVSSPHLALPGLDLAKPQPLVRHALSTKTACCRCQRQPATAGVSLEHVAGTPTLGRSIAQARALTGGRNYPAVAPSTATASRGRDSVWGVALTKPAEVAHGRQTVKRTCSGRCHGNDTSCPARTQTSPLTVPVVSTKKFKRR